MNKRFQTYILGNSCAPLSTLAGGGLLIIASSRVAFALVACAALLWVYGFTVLSAFVAKPILPKRGIRVILLFLSSLIGSLFLLVLWLMSPLLALGSAFIILLCPVYCMGSELFTHLDSQTLEEALLKTLLDAALLGLLIIAFALIREPLGFMSLSVPVREGPGMLELFKEKDSTSLFPIRLLSSAGGGLLLLGYGVALFRQLRKPSIQKEL
ncbi:MAG: hypothetical protein LBC51_03565 [Treponema sp.]|jgi:hypothetical protein|nr:hypothetical protein [Treponema sp.]